MKENVPNYWKKAKNDFKATNWIALFLIFASLSLLFFPQIRAEEEEDNEPPVFSGLLSVTTSSIGGKPFILDWSPAEDNSSVLYNIYISTTSKCQNFSSPNATTDNAWTELDESEYGFKGGVRYYFVVRAEDSYGNEDNNTVERSEIYPYRGGVVGDSNSDKNSKNEDSLPSSEILLRIILIFGFIAFLIFYAKKKRFLILIFFLLLCSMIILEESSAQAAPSFSSEFLEDKGHISLNSTNNSYNTTIRVTNTGTGHITIENKIKEIENITIDYPGSLFIPQGGYTDMWANFTLNKTFNETAEREANISQKIIKVGGVPYCQDKGKSIFAYLFLNRTSLPNITGKEYQKFIESGKNRTFLLNITNLGNGNDTFELSLLEIPSGWNASFNLTLITLRENSTREVMLNITAPKNATNNEKFCLNVTVRSIFACFNNTDFWEGVVIVKNPNHAPVVELETPQNKEIIEESEITLKWTGFDEDKDNLNFTIFIGFSTQNFFVPEENYTETHYNLTGLIEASYFWKIKVFDGNLSNESKIREFSVDLPNQSPTAFIDSITPTNAKVGESVSFAARGEDDGHINSYWWRSSISGFLSDKKSFTRSNLSVGIHTIYLKVKDNENVWSNEDSFVLTIYKNQKPIPILKSDKSVIFVGETLHFEAWQSYDSDGEISHFLFDFGDGNNSGWIDVSNISHRYTKFGTFIVILKVQDNNGEENSTILYLEVKEEEKEIKKPELIVNLPKKIFETGERIIISGTLKYSSGAPIENVLIVLKISAAGKEFEKRTDNNGAFEFETRIEEEGIFALNISLFIDGEELNFEEKIEVVSSKKEDSDEASLVIFATIFILGVISVILFKKGFNR